MKTNINRIIKTMFILCTLLAFNAVGYAQNSTSQPAIISIENTIDEFEDIVVDQDFNLYIFEGTSNKIIIETEEKIIKYVIAEVVDKTLNITCSQKIDNPKVLNIFVTTSSLHKITVSGRIKIKIYPRVTNNIELYLANETSYVRLYLSDMIYICSAKGYGSIFTEGNFKELIFYTSDEIKLKLDVNTGLLKCYSIDKSYVNISGISKSLKLFAQDETGINAFNMYTDKCSVNVKDASEVYVNKSEELYIAGENKSNVEYTGESVVIVKALNTVKVKNIKEKKIISVK